MLKWFRKYNKFILVIGCAVLMVAFLIPQAIEQFSPKPGDRVVATVDGEDVTGSELQQETVGLQVLQQMGLGALVPYTEEQWFLLLRDADAAGIGASDVEVIQALAGMGLDPAGDDLQTFADRLGQPPEALQGVVRDLLIAERYRMLASGHRFDSTAATLSSSPGLVSIQMLNQAAQFLNGEQAQQLGPGFRQQLWGQFRRSLDGTGRLSPPFVTNVLFEESERLGGRLAVVEPEVTDGVRAAVTDERVERLFHEYAGFLPGTGSPYPFGYRVPDRVKLEYLAVPASEVRSTLSVGTVDVLEAYRAQNPGQTPDEAQREATRERLLGEATAAKLREIANQIRGSMESARRGLETDLNGRLLLPEGESEDLSLDAVADAVQEAHGVRPEVTRRTDDWVSLDEAATLDGLAFSGLPDLGMGFGTLLRELPALRAEPEGSALAAEARVDPVPVQVGAAMPLLTNPQDGSLYLARVTAVDPSHEPESVADVREEVASDAARVLAYESLLERKDDLVSEAVASGLDALEAAQVVVDVPPFPRRTRRGSVDGRPAAPALPEVGRSPALVDAAFEAVAGLGPDETVESLPEAERFVAEGVDGRLALGILRVDTLERPTRSDLAGDVASGVLTGLDRTLLAEGDQDPLAEDALRERLGFRDDS